MRKLSTACTAVKLEMSHEVSLSFRSSFLPKCGAQPQFLSRNNAACGQRADHMQRNSGAPFAFIVFHSPCPLCTQDFCTSACMCAIAIAVSFPHPRKRKGHPWLLVFVGSWFEKHESKKQALAFNTLPDFFCGKSASPAGNPAPNCERTVLLLEEWFAAQRAQLL